MRDEDRSPEFLIGILWTVGNIDNCLSKFVAKFDSFFDLTVWLSTEKNQMTALTRYRLYSCEYSNIIAAHIIALSPS